MDFHALFLRNKFWITDFLHGSPIGKPYREIRYICNHSEVDGKQIREKALHKLLDYYRRNSVYYSEFSGYDLSTYPVQNKSSLIANHESMSVPFEVIPGQRGDVYIQKTSGSTGNPLAMPQDTRKRQRRVAEIKYFGQIVGFASHEKLIHLRTWNQWQQKSPAEIKKDNIVPFDVKRIGEEDMLELCKLIIHEKAISIRGYASCFDRISKVASKYGFSFPSLKIITSTSESLEDSVRAATKKSLGCEIISQYANEECGILAQERIPTKDADNKMYFNWASYYIEFLKIDSDTPADYGEIGRIVLTDLYNYAFPVIRYDTGDTGVLLPPDEYSNGYPVLGKLYGRRFDLTYATDGTPIYPLAFGRILKNYSAIRQWQIIQKAQNEFQVKLVLSEESSKTKSEIVNEIKQIVGLDAKIEITHEDEIPVLSSGKRKPVINEWKRQNE